MAVTQLYIPTMNNVGYLTPDVVVESVLSSTATSYSITGLATQGGQSTPATVEYIYWVTLGNATAGSIAISLNVNGDTTATNYYTEQISISGPTVTAAKNNTPVMINISANNEAQLEIHCVRSPTGFFFAWYMGMNGQGGANASVFGSVTKTNASITSIDSLQIVSDTGTSLAINSIFTLGRFRSHQR